MRMEGNRSRSRNCKNTYITNTTSRIVKCQEKIARERERKRVLVIENKRQEIERESEQKERA